MKNVARENPLAAILREQAKVILSLADVLETDAGRTRAASEYVNQNTAPIGKRRFLAAAGRADFPTFKTGKLVLAKRADFEAWLTTSSRVVVCAAEPTDAPALSDEDSLRSKLGLRIVGGAR